MAKHMSPSRCRSRGALHRVTFRRRRPGSLGAMTSDRQRRRGCNQASPFTKATRVAPPAHRRPPSRRDRSPLPLDFSARPVRPKACSDARPPTVPHGDPAPAGPAHRARARTPPLPGPTRTSRSLSRLADLAPPTAPARRSTVTSPPPTARPRSGTPRCPSKHRHPSRWVRPMTRPLLRPKGNRSGYPAAPDRKRRFAALWPKQRLPLAIDLYAKVRTAGAIDRHRDAVTLIP